MADYGTDVSTFPGFDTTGRTITGARVVAEACLRRLMTPRGSLPYDLDYGYDLRDLLNEDLSAGDLRRHELAAELELEKDERIDSADVTLTLDTSTFTLSIRITGTLSNAAAFAFTLAVGQVSAAVLKVE